MSVAKPHCPASDVVDFCRFSATMSWGLLETPRFVVGVKYMWTPVSHLLLKPPLRVPEECAETFSDAIVDRAAADERWMSFGMDREDGEVIWGVALDGPLDDTLFEAREFLEANFDFLAGLCVPKHKGDDEREDDCEDDSEEDMLASLFEHLFGC